MPAGKLIFSQLTEWIHPEQFRRCVARYHGNRKVYNFPCWDQFLAMSFAQITYRDSLADIEVCLRSRHDQLYRLGFRSTIAHSTLADANSSRNWRIYHDLAQGLIARARRLYASESFGVELEQTVYALDSTTIDLCLSLFPWARFRSTKAAVKLHTLLDLRGPIPTMISISEGKRADVSILDELMLEPGAFYVMDRGYWYALVFLIVAAGGTGVYASFLWRGGHWYNPLRLIALAFLLTAGLWGFAFRGHPPEKLGPATAP